MKLIFELGGDMVIVRIEDKNVSFATSDTNFSQFVPIDNLNLSIQGILKEFPELRRLPDKEIRKEAVKRFKNHIQNLGGEDDIKKYIIAELEKEGYVLK